MTLTARQAEIRRLVAGRVRYLLDQQTHTRAWLAAELGEDKSGIARLLASERPVDLELVERLAAAFHISKEDFLGGGPRPVWPAPSFESAHQDFVRYVKEEMVAARGRLGRQLTLKVIDSVTAAAEGLTALTDELARLQSQLRGVEGLLAEPPPAPDLEIEAEHEWEELTEQWQRDRFDERDATEP